MLKRASYRIPNPVNDVQVRFNELCEAGGGRHGGPARTKVQELLHTGGRKLTDLGHEEINLHLSEFPEADPWHVCFVIGLGWGHLAKIELDFTAAALPVLAELDEDALRVARTFHYERGPLSVEQSLRAGYLMFQKVRLPEELPSSLHRYRRAQERWLGPLVSPTGDRPKYMGSWNATAMFMVGLFSTPKLAAELLSPEISLPPNGPIFAALRILYDANVLDKPPAGSELDDQDFEPGAIYENNALMADLIRGRHGWSMIDLHSGLYMLGTRYPHSNEWS